jgi:transcription antitermination factor NusG
MTLEAGTGSSDRQSASIPDSYIHQQWYAAYVCANHEKCVAKELKARSLEHFLPLYCSIRRWRDRRVKLDLPLFPSYVFVRLALSEKLRVLQVPGVVNLVGFKDGPVALPDEEIQTLRSRLAEGLRAEPHPFLTVGRRVRVKHGPLAGLEGILLRRKGRSRVVVSLKAIMRSIVADVDETELAPIIQVGVKWRPT